MWLHIHIYGAWRVCLPSEQVRPFKTPSQCAHHQQKRSHTRVSRILYSTSDTYTRAHTRAYVHTHHQLKEPCEGQPDPVLAISSPAAREYVFLGRL